MLVLALDTATPASSAALVEVTDDGSGGVRGIAERRTVDARAHGERLAPEITAVLAEAGVRPGELGAIVAGLGPGPFTGLRVGLVTAAGMGQALGIPTYGVCSLDGIGRAAGAGRFLVATDARRREVYYASYVDGVRIFGPEVAKPADVLATLPGSGTTSDTRSAPPGPDAGPDALAGKREGAKGEVRAGDSGGLLPTLRGAGEGVVKYRDIFGVQVNEDLQYPPLVALVDLAAERIRTNAPGEILTPLYLRRPDAVEPGTRKPVLS